MAAVSTLRNRYFNKHSGYKHIVRPVARLATFLAAPACIYFLTGPLAKASDQSLVLAGSAIEHILIGLWMCMFIFYLAKVTHSLIRRIGSINNLLVVFALAVPITEAYLIQASLPTALLMTSPIVLVACLWQLRKNTAKSTRIAYEKYLDSRLNTANLTIPLHSPGPIKKTCT